MFETPRYMASVVTGISFANYAKNHILHSTDDKGIIPNVKLVTEAKPRDAKRQVVLFPSSILGRKHILMAQSMAEVPNIYIYINLFS